ncbi:hypothetical protein JGU66_06965 [Myxococcaceae bacterium JPH2]|nr:hypothetical protein [Myxococcaceae bacterium JPH2]
MRFLTLAALSWGRGFTTRGGMGNLLRKSVKDWFVNGTAWRGASLSGGKDA